MTLDSWRAGNAEDKFLKAKAIIYQVRNSGFYTPTRLPPVPNVAAGPSTSLYDPPKINLYSASTAGTSAINHYDPYAPPRRPSGVSAPLPTPSSSSQKVPGIRFKDSPFFSIDQAVTAVVECPESTSATDRRQQSLSFTLNNDQISKLKTPGDRYQLRLFCTSSIFYAGINSFRSNTMPCPMEFPPTCEVRVNNTQITANLKGLKKKPGTAPPPDIGKYSRITGGPNRVEMVYVNSQHPVQSKFYMIVMLVAVTTIENLVINLRAQHQKSANEVRQKMQQSMVEDDDIIAGPQKMSLRCPLTFMRIVTPCRSSKCVHPQCFDAHSWFTMMEQTTTWLCPVCERTLDHKDLIMDGYFDEILQATPESVEDVMVEADGQWHTVDNKYGSADWKAAHPLPEKLSSPSKSLPPPKQSPSCPPADAKDTGQSNGKGKAPSHEIFVLDSDDDEDEGRVKRELSPSYASSANQSFEGTLPPMSQSLSRADTSVIDLTLDESDEDDEPLPTVYGKRRAADAELDSPNATDQIWKKGRVDPSSRILPTPRGPGTVNGVTPALHSSSVNNHQSASPHHYGSFSNNTLPLPTPYTFTARNGSSSSSLQLPPLSSSFLSRQSQNARWPA